MIIKAYAEENPVFTTPSFDGGWRVWKKSDPATTGAKAYIYSCRRIFVWFSSLAIVGMLSLVITCWVLSVADSVFINFVLFTLSYDRCLRPTERGLHYQLSRRKKVLSLLQAHAAGYVYLFYFVYFILFYFLMCVRAVFSAKLCILNPCSLCIILLNYCAQLIIIIILFHIFFFSFSSFSSTQVPRSTTTCRCCTTGRAPAPSCRA